MTLREYLFHNSIEQKSFAAQLGISMSMLSRIKTGDRKPSVDVAKRIERATGKKVTAASLLKEKA